MLTHFNALISQSKILFTSVILFDPKQKQAVIYVSKEFKFCCDLTLILMIVMRKSGTNLLGGWKYRYCLALTLFISFVLQIARIFLFIFFFVHMWTHFDEASVFSVIPHKT